MRSRRNRRIVAENLNPLIGSLIVFIECRWYNRTTPPFIQQYEWSHSTVKQSAQTPNAVKRKDIGVPEDLPSTTVAIIQMEMYSIIQMQMYSIIQIQMYQYFTRFNKSKFMKPRVMEINYVST